MTNPSSVESSSVYEAQQNYDANVTALNESEQQFNGNGDPASAPNSVMGRYDRALDQMNAYSAEGDTEGAFVMAYVIMFMMMSVVGGQIDVQSNQEQVVSSLNDLVSSAQSSWNQLLADPSDTQAGDEFAAYLGLIYQDGNSPECSFLGSSTINQIDNCLDSVASAFGCSSVQELMQWQFNPESMDGHDGDDDGIPGVNYMASSWDNASGGVASGQTITQNGLDGMSTLLSSVTGQLTTQMNTEGQAYSQLLSMNQTMLKEYLELIAAQIKNELI
jgi:hypothetical protein